MSTDSTELTFVRCPSCRSLVPAVSTRCRMCGAALEAAPNEEEGSQADDQSRVRQRTSAAPDKDLASAAEQVRNAMAAPEGQAEAGEFEDPLSAYIEEVAPEPKAANGKGSAAQFKEPPAPEPEAATSSEPKVVIETGGKRGKGSGLSFGAGAKSKEAQPQQPAKQKQQQPQQQPRQEAQNPPEQGQPNRNKRRKRKNSERNAMKQQQQNIPAEAGQVVKQGKRQTGRLFAWLVSFDSPMLSSIEIREGQFFITSQALKDNDLLVDHPSVSTPHAMVAVGQDGGFRVRDLMSDNGVHIKRKGEQSFTRFEGEERLNNGDWIRFGEVKYLVSLLPDGGE